MVVSAILWIIYYAVYLLTSPLRLLADVTVLGGVGMAITNATRYVANWSTFLPVSTIFAVFGIIIGIELIIATYKLIMWIIRRIPTQS